MVTSGVFELDGGSWEVDNNVWVVGDSSEVIVIDAAHDADAIRSAVGGRHVVAIVCTHGHNDHITCAPELGVALDAPVLLSPSDEMLWRMTHGSKEFRPLPDGQTLRAGGVEIRAIATPALTGIDLPVRTRVGRFVLRRHALPGRTGRHRAFVLGLPRPFSGRSRIGWACCLPTPSSTRATVTPRESATS